MKSIAKLTRRFVGILSLSTVLILFVNFLLLIWISSNQTAGGGPWTTAKETAQALQKTEEHYELSNEMSARLLKEDAWAIYIANDTMNVQWQTDNLPDTIPKEYTISGIASLTRGYIDGYPTYTAETEEGLVVVGYPRDRYWKHLTPSWDYSFIANAPYIALGVIGVNILVIFLIYIIANTKMLKSIRPITTGIQALPDGERIIVKENGLLSELAVKINETSQILEEQRRNLRKKETARANWISSVSHDIRTPLSMVMGYAGQLEKSTELSDENRRKAEIIRSQSTRMKNLINDLNLSSKLEYNMQPLRLQPVNLVAVARQSVADYMNADLEENYPIEWNTAEEMDACMIKGDKELLLRAVNNLFNNSQAHNPDGCRIFMEVQADLKGYHILVEDDGVGITDKKLEELRSTPHYMMNDDGTTEPRHGLGLLIVQQIVSVHGGTVTFEHGKQKGFAVRLTFPKEE